VSGTEGRRSRIAVTMGDPAGVGPEVVLRTMSSGKLPLDVDFVVVGSSEALEVCRASMSIDSPADVVDVGPAPAEPGRPTEAGARAALDSVRVAAEMCLGGAADAMVTAPVSKSAISALGLDFVGHTEYLAGLTGASDFVMTFVAGQVRVALATTHMAISDVPGALTRELLVSRLRTLDSGLKEWFGVRAPTIAVAALNPHAGESGQFGREESETIAPALAEAAEKGLDVLGPLPADSLFARMGVDGGGETPYDAVLAMYHDQGTIPAKLLARGRGVNVTVGLPIVRTSVDHGTGFDVAGSGRADHGSMMSAVTLAAEIARRVRSESDGRA